MSPVPSYQLRRCALVSAGEDSGQLCRIAEDRVRREHEANEVRRPIRLTDEALRARPEWRNFGGEEGRHPPMRGWLAVPLIGSDGDNYGFIQVSDRLEGDFTAQDEANLLRLAALTATALDALAQLHLPKHRAKVADPGQ